MNQIMTCAKTFKSDFHMALKLQQEELEQGSSDLSPNDTWSQASTENDNVDKEALQLEADAAAALLHLKARK